MMFLNKQFLICIAVGLTLILTMGCSNKVEYADSTSPKAIVKTMDELESLDVKSDFEYYDLLKEKIGLFLLYSTDDIPEVTKKKLANEVEEQLRSIGFMPIFRGPEAMNALLEKNPKLGKMSETYFNTMQEVTVSDMDLSNPIGKYLDVDEFLIFQVDLWPCETCIARDIMRLKLRLVTAEDGMIVWTGIHEISSISETADRNLMAEELAFGLIDEFFHKFKRKWHKKRYHQLRVSEN